MPTGLIGRITLLAADSFWESIGVGFQSMWSRPLIALSLFTLPLVLIAFFARAYPRMRLLALCIVPVLLTPAIVFRLSFRFRCMTADAAFWIIVIDAVIVLVALFDLITLPRKRDFTAKSDHWSC